MKYSATVSCVSQIMDQQPDAEEEDGSRGAIQRSVSFDRRAWARVEARSLDGGGGSLSVVRYDPSAIEAAVQQLPLYDRFRSWLSGSSTASGGAGQGTHQSTYSQVPIVSKVVVEWIFTLFIADLV